MKTLRIILLVFMTVISFSGCDTLASHQKDSDKKNKEAVSQGVYATNDSMKVGRFDLAKKYSDETLRLVNPPEKRIEIKGIYK